MKQTKYVISAQVEHIRQKIHFLQPQSTPDPSCVSLPVKCLNHYTHICMYEGCVSHQLQSLL